MDGIDNGIIGSRTKLAIIDPHPLFRTGVIHILREVGSLEIVAEGESATDALNIVENYSVDIMLLDVTISGGWKEAMSSIMGMRPGMRLVVLSASEQVEHVSSAMQLGARGYILKHVGVSTLIDALRAIAAGQVYLTPSLGAQLFARTLTPGNQNASSMTGANLTPREIQIISQVSIGATNKEIARSLKITEKTVKFYMTNIMQKLHVRNRVEAVLAINNLAKSSA